MSEEVKRLTRRASAAFGAVGLSAAILVASLLSAAPGTANAFTASGGQVQSRAIYMSTSTPSATAQKYLVSFKPAATTSLKGVIVDFCSTSPIIGDSTCTAPTSFTVGTPTVTFAGTATPNDPITTTGLPGSWTASSLNSGRTLKLVDAGAGSGALSTSTTYSFVITTVTNPSTVGTFYARILTYNSNAGDIASYAPGTEGTTNLVDYGGFALSTTNNINITAKVQETLQFCVVSADPSPGNTCGTGGFVSSNLPNLTIGHGSPVATIDNSAVDATTAYMQISTNATNGAQIRMHAGNSCASSSNNAGLSSNGGALCSIPGMDNTTASAMPTIPNTGQAYFGLFVGTGYLTSGVAASTGTIAADANYHDPAHVNEAAPDTGLYYGMDNTVASGVISNYGDKIADTAGAPCNTVNAHLVFAAVASLTTPAGIYQGSESLIATGTF